MDTSTHQRWFGGLLFRPLPSAVESLHTQRLLLLYFGVLGSSIGGCDWVRDSISTQQSKVVAALRACYDAEVGGFYAEPQEHYVGVVTVVMTHCAIHALWSMGQLTHAAQSWLDISSVRSFVLSCLVTEAPHCASGGEDHRGAFAAFPQSKEVDVRFTYSALMTLFMLQHTDEVPAHLASIGSVIAEDDLQLDGTVRRLVQSFLVRCWSPCEGGFSGVPGGEAHGGMTYCSVSSLALLGWWAKGSSTVRSIRRRALRWCVQRHGCGPVANEEAVEDEWDHWDRVGRGQGFQGRPNKTHDTCYTFWVGAACSILEAAELVDASPALGPEGGAPVMSLLDDERLAEFAVSCAGVAGGFGRDGPDADPVHSALGFAGLSCRVGVAGRRLHPVFSTIVSVGLGD